MKYIEDEIAINIRFSEVDSLGIVWHGNYLKFFEDGREYLGLKYGMSYLDLYEHKLILPIVDTQLKFRSVLKFGHEARLVTRLYHSPAAKLRYTYSVFNDTTGKLAAWGETIQVFVDENMELQLITPAVFEAWKSKQEWREE